MQRVHSLKGLPEFDIDLTYDKNNPGDYGGMFANARSNPDGTQMMTFQRLNINLAGLEGSLTKGMGMSDAKKRLKMTTIHELGHTLDLTALGSSNNRFATAAIDANGKSIPNSAEPSMASLVSTLSNSQGVNRIRAATESATNPQVKAYGEYLLSTHEIFARGYTQYIATKSGDRGLQQHLQEFGLSTRKNANSRYGNGQWDEEEFNSTIVPEFDKVFRDKGWLHD